MPTAYLKKVFLRPLKSRLTCRPPCEAIATPSGDEDLHGLCIPFNKILSRHYKKRILTCRLLHTALRGYSQHSI